MDGGQNNQTKPWLNVTIDCLGVYSPILPEKTGLERHSQLSFERGVSKFVKGTSTSKSKFAGTFQNATRYIPGLTVDLFPIHPQTLL